MGLVIMKKKRIVLQSLIFKGLKIVIGNIFGVKIQHFGKGRISLNVVGKDNYIEVRRGTVLHRINVKIRGNNNQLVIGKNCRIGKGCSFWMEGNNIKIEIGDETTVSRDVQLCAQEDGTFIKLGNDCMLSNTITIRTSDSHPIYSKETEKRTNMPKSVLIGNHVWVAPNSKIFKGSHIGDGAIIGSDSLVTGDIKENSLAVGHPAKVVRNNVEWRREQLF